MHSAERMIDPMDRDLPAVQGRDPSRLVIDLAQDDERIAGRLHLEADAMQGTLGKRDVGALELGRKPFFIDVRDLCGIEGGRSDATQEDVRIAHLVELGDRPGIAGSPGELVHVRVPRILRLVLGRLERSDRPGAHDVLGVEHREHAVRKEDPAVDQVLIDAELGGLIPAQRFHPENRIGIAREQVVRREDAHRPGELGQEFHRSSPRNELGRCRTWLHLVELRVHAPHVGDRQHEDDPEQHLTGAGGYRWPRGQNEERA